MAIGQHVGDALLRAAARPQRREILDEERAEILLSGEQARVLRLDDLAEGPPDDEIQQHELLEAGRRRHHLVGGVARIVTRVGELQRPWVPVADEVDLGREVRGPLIEEGAQLRQVHAHAVPIRQLERVRRLADRLDHGHET